MLNIRQLKKTAYNKFIYNYIRLFFHVWRLQRRVAGGRHL